MGNHGRAIFLLFDYADAFTSVSHRYLLHSLKAINIPHKLIRLVNTLYTTAMGTFICPSPSPSGRKVGTRAWTPPFGAMLGGASASCADPDLQRAARSERTAMQPRNPHMRQSSDHGKTATRKRAKPTASWRKPLRLTYWNVNGMGSEWDGTHSSKFAALQQSGPYDAILLVETHLKCLRLCTRP